MNKWLFSFINAIITLLIFMLCITIMDSVNSIQYTSQCNNFEKYLVLFVSIYFGYLTTDFVIMYNN